MYMFSCRCVLAQRCSSQTAEVIRISSSDQIRLGGGICALPMLLWTNSLYESADHYSTNKDQAELYTLQKRRLSFNSQISYWKMNE